MLPPTTLLELVKHCQMFPRTAVAKQLQGQCWPSTGGGQNAELSELQIPSMQIQHHRSAQQHRSAHRRSNVPVVAPQVAMKLATTLTLMLALLEQPLVLA